MSPLIQGQSWYRNTMSKLVDRERGGEWAGWNILMGPIHRFPPPTPTCFCLYKSQILKNFKASSVWQTVIKQEIVKKKKTAKDMEEVDDSVVMVLFCNQQPNCGALPPGGELSPAVTLMRGGQRKVSAESARRAQVRSAILPGWFHPVLHPKLTAAPVRL